MKKLKCSECGHIFEDSLNDCPNCGCPASECEKIVEAENIVEKSNDTYVTNECRNVVEDRVFTVNDLLNTDWANKVYECGVLYWNTLKKRYFDFSGRASRLEYWNFVIISLWVTVTSWGFGGIIVVIPLLAVSVRRMHDINRSGWWIIMPWISIFFQFKKSDVGNNDYGTPSKIKL